MTGEHEKLIEAARAVVEKASPFTGQSMILNDTYINALRDALPPPFPAARAKYADGTKWVDTKGVQHYVVLNGRLWIGLKTPQADLGTDWHKAESREAEGLTRIDPPSVAALASGELRAVEKASPVRCWRHKDGPLDSEHDRLRWTGTVMEWVSPSGSVSPTDYRIAHAEQFARDGDWVYCPDSPSPVLVAASDAELLARGVADIAAGRVHDHADVRAAFAPAPVATPEVPPDGTRWIGKVSPMYEWRMHGGKLQTREIPNGGDWGSPRWMVAVEDLRKDVARGGMIEHPPAPAPARESAEVVAERLWYSSTESDGADDEIVADIAKEITARDATFTADLAAKDATIARLEERNAELDRLRAGWDIVWKIAQDTSRRDNARLAALESRPAGEGEDLLETAREILAAMLIDTGGDTLDPDYTTPDNRRLADKVAERAVAFARDLHAALRGEAPR